MFTVYPELVQRAIAMEDRAVPSLQTVKGLGRSFNWRQYLEGKIDPETATIEDAVCMYCVD